MSGKLEIIPNAYTLNIYKQTKCLCISSRSALVYVSISETNLSGFSGGSDIEEPHSVLKFMSLFKHSPYTPIELKGDYIQEGDVYFFTRLEEWVNLNPKYENKDIATGFFDIEVEGYGNVFPTPEKDEIKCISFKKVGEDTQVFTTFSMEELKRHYERKGSKNLLLDYVYFPNQFDMIVHFIKEVLTLDRIGGYNSRAFDWHFILSVMLRLTKGTTFWEDISKIKPARVDNIIYQINGRIENRYVLEVPGLEHFDLLPIVHRLYPYWPNHKLDTCGKKLIGAGKSGFDIQDYFVLIRDYKTTIAANKPLREDTLNLLEEAMIYSRVDCDILEDIYNALADKRAIAQELCCLTIQDWTELTEAEGLLFRIDSKASTRKIKPNKLELKEGVYKNVSIYLDRDTIFDCCKSEPLKKLLRRLRTNSGLELANFLPIFDQLFGYVKYVDSQKYLDRTKAEVGRQGAYIYTDREDNDSQVYVHARLVVPSASSWISWDRKEDQFETKGKAKLVTETFNKAISIIKKAISKKDKKWTDKRISRYLFGTEGKVNISDFVEHKKINLKGYEEFEKYLTNEEKTALKSLSSDYVNLYYLETTTGKMRVYYPYKDIDALLKEDYYISSVKEHLAKLEKLRK